MTITFLKPTGKTGFPAKREDVDVAALANAIWRGKVWILALVLGALLSGWLYAENLLAPTYTATATLAIDGRAPQIAGLDPVVSERDKNEAALNTEVEILRSPALTGKLVERLALGDDPEFAGADLSQMIAAARRAIGVTPVKNSRVLKIEVTTGEPEKSALIANTLTALYLQDQVDAKTKAAESSAIWLANQVRSLQLDLENAEVSSLVAQAGLGGGGSAISPELRTLYEAMDQIKLDGPQVALETRIAGKSGAQITQRRTQAEVETSRDIYEYFLARYKEASAQKGIQSPDGRLISAALVPGETSSPSATTILLFAGLAGLFGGIAISILREVSQNTFRTGASLEQDTGLTVHGQIPRFPVDGRGDVLAYAVAQPSSHPVEAVRDLRTSLLLSGPSGVIMSTSSLAGEGKTTQAILLALNLASMGKKVLLVEAELRRSVFTAYFGAANPRGLVSVLNGSAALADAITHDQIAGLDILRGERPINSAADVLSSHRFAEFIDEARDLYDHIVIDTPPVLMVPDARLIGQLVDATLYAVRWDVTSRTQVMQGLERLSGVGVKNCGLAFSQVDMKRLQRYGYTRYGGYNYSSDIYATG